MSFFDRQLDQRPVNLKRKVCFVLSRHLAGIFPAKANLTALYTNENTTPTLGVNLAQVLITPTLAYKINDHHSVGFSPVIGNQTFRAYGLGLFQAFSSDPGNVTNNGNDDAWGFGARVGYQATYGSLRDLDPFVQLALQEIDAMGSPA